MRKLVAILFVAYLLQVNGFEKFDLHQSLDTVTSELLAAQRELSITHEFSELQAYINRNVITSYIELMNEILIGSFMETFREIIAIEDTVRSEINEKPPSSCVDRIRTRFDLQVQRHGVFLSRCMRTSHGVLQGWIDRTNSLHFDAQLTLNQAQNQGLAGILERSRVDSHESFYPRINRRLRILLTSVRSYLEEFEQFRDEIVNSEQEIIDELTRCDREILERFREAAEFELLLIRGCL